MGKLNHFKGAKHVEGGQRGFPDFVNAEGVRTPVTSGSPEQANNPSNPHARLFDDPIPASKMTTAKKNDMGTGPVLKGFKSR